MLIRIINEKQISNTRLLILDKCPLNNNDDKVMIDGKFFKRLNLYDLSNAIAIECPKETESFIGKTI